MVEKKRYSILIFPVVAIVFMGLGLGALSGIDYSWSGWQPASCMPDHCFCEAQQDALIRQPINAYTNLAFIFVGLVIFFIAQSDRLDSKRHHLIGSHWIYPLLFALALIITGGGSFFYHASFTFIGQWFDVFGMYLIATFALIYAYARLRPIRRELFLIGYLAMNAMLGYTLIVRPDLRREIFAALIYAVIALEVLYAFVEHPRIKLRYIVGAIGSLAVAYGIWFLDNNTMLCDPTSMLQGHAVWHLLGALAAFLLFLYYRSEIRSTAI